MNNVYIMTADVLVPCGTRSSAEMDLKMQGKQVIHEEGLQENVPP